MLNDRPEERDTLFKEIVLKKSSVRMVEQLARRIATDKIRKHDKTPEVMELEKSLTETLGTRVLIENRPNGGRVLIEFFSPEDLSHIAAILAERKEAEAVMSTEATASAEVVVGEMPIHPNTTQVSDEIIPAEPEPPEEDLYSVSSFAV
jgi:hypothetical protein